MGAAAWVSPAAPTPRLTTAHQEREKRLSKNRRVRRSLEAIKRKYAESVGAEIEDDGSVLVEFEAYDEVWRIPHPLFATDDWQERVDAATTNADKARAVLGDEQYERWRAAGGTSGEVMLMLLDITQDMQDTLPGEGGGPTRS